MFFSLAINKRVPKKAVTNGTLSPTPIPNKNPPPKMAFTVFFRKIKPKPPKETKKGNHKAFREPSCS